MRHRLPAPLVRFSSLMLRILPLVALLCAGTAPLQAQSPSNPLPSIFNTASALLPSTIDSQAIDNPSNQATVVFAQPIQVTGSPWLQLQFGENISLPAGSFLRITSMRDGGVQRHTGETIVEWGAQSAFFNGDQVFLELVAGPNTSKNRVDIDAIQYGLLSGVGSTICGDTDDRVQSFDDRQGRLFIGCTGWLIGLNDTGDRDLMITAGHCVDSSATRIIEFNVPLSTPGGGIVRSNPDDQYPFTRDAFLNAGVGSDWGVNLVGRNSNTLQLPTEANGGQFYNLGTVPATPDGNDIRITGYGSVQLIDPSLNLVQKTLVGPMQNGLNANSLNYGTDTTGGNSGSPVIHEQTGDVIGVHTHGGCSDTGGGNNGTRIDRPDFDGAIGDARRIRGLSTAFGSGCGSFDSFCFEVNPSGGTLSDEFRTNEYAYQFTLQTETTVNGFELFTASTGGDITIEARLYASDGSEPSAVLATSMMTVGDVPAFYPATFAPTLLAPGTYYVAVDSSNQDVQVSTLQSGSPGQAFFRNPPFSGNWNPSTLVQRPSFRVDCTGGVAAFAGTEPRIGQALETGLVSGEVGTPAALLLGFSNTSSGGTPLPIDLDGLGAIGCQLLIDSVSSESVMTDANGGASSTLAMPSNNALIGLSLFQQWLVLAPGANPLNVLTSNGLERTLGN